jgi:hypothetical protein
VQAESQATKSLTIFFVTIDAVYADKRLNRLCFTVKGNLGRLRAVKHLAIESGGGLVKVRLAQGRWGIDGNGWDFTVRRAMKG